jgi:pimeloyl-ACP methyl ester carboxylesterase
LEHPRARTAGLVLIGTGARLRVTPEILENTTSPLTFQKAIDTIVQKSYAPDVAEPHLRTLTAQAISCTTRNTVLHGDYQACNGFDVMERVCEIQAKTLVLCGADDEMTPPRYAQYLAAQIPNASGDDYPKRRSHGYAGTAPGSGGGSDEFFTETALIEKKGHIMTDPILSTQNLTVYYGRHRGIEGC